MNISVCTDCHLNSKLLRSSCVFVQDAPPFARSRRGWAPGAADGAAGVHMNGGKGKQRESLNVRLGGNWAGRHPMAGIADGEGGSA